MCNLLEIIMRTSIKLPIKKVYIDAQKAPTSQLTSWRCVALALHCVRLYFRFSIARWFIICNVTPEKVTLMLNGLFACRQIYHFVL